ncbi:SOCS7 protein, partial [Polyodon spathula]|nr:SOCS7 protein [Polyodon spathula]
MNNAQADINMSPDFVLMRLVSAAEDDNLDQENGNLSAAASSSFGPSVLLGQHHNNGILLQNGFEFDLNNKTAQQQTGNGAAASPEDAMPTTRPLEPLVSPLPADPTMAQRFDFHHRTKGSRPQLMVFRNILRPGDRDHHGPGQHDVQIGEFVLERQGPCCDVNSSASNSISTAASASVVTRSGGPELCHRHRLATGLIDWTPASEMLLDNTLDHRDLLDTRWASPAPGGGESGTAAASDPVFELARKFGEFGVDGAAVLFGKEGELPRCPCQGLLGSAGIGLGPGEDPTETSDALLVLEGLESEEMDGLGMSSTCSEEDFKNDTAAAFLLNGKGSAGVMRAMNSFSGSTLTGLMRQDGCCPGYREPQACCPLRDVLDSGAAVAQQCQTSPDERSPMPIAAATPNGVSPCGSTLDLPAPSQDPNHKVRVSRRASSTLSVASGGGREKAARGQGKSRKGSLKIRLSRLFRTKSCNGSNEPLDKRHSVDLAVSAGSLDVMDVSGSNGREKGRKTRLTRTLSAFSPASFSPVFTGETVSLVDVDISQRGLNSPHPPTPPPPPRRSLSLLDDINGPQPGPFLAGSMGASLQSLPLPLPPPPPSHATIQHSLSLNDTFLRALPRSSSSSLQGDVQPPATQPPPAQALHCPLSRPDPCSFAASLRELEKVREKQLPGPQIESVPYRSTLITARHFHAHQDLQHVAVLFTGTFSLWCHPKFEDRCQSVVEFIERAIMHSKNGKFLYFLRSRVPVLPPISPPSPSPHTFTLTSPDLCSLAPSRPLIAYLRKFYYYDPEEETHLSLKEARGSLSPEQEAEAQT